MRLPAARCGATSVSQMAVSAASTWQKNGRDTAEAVMAPMLEQASGFGTDLPLTRREATPGVDVVANLVDDRCLLVLLLLGRERRVPDDQFALPCLPLLRMRDRRDELRAPAVFENRIRRLPLRVKLPVLARLPYGEFRIGCSKKDGIGRVWRFYRGRLVRVRTPESRKQAGAGSSRVSAEGDKAIVLNR